VTRQNPAAPGLAPDATVTISNPVTIQPGECFVVLEDQSSSGHGSDVTVTETSSGLQAISGQHIENGGSPTSISAPANGGTYFINSIHGVRLTFTNSVTVAGCTFTQGYWKTHGPTPKGNNSNEWDLVSITLGSTPYTQAEALSIFNTAVKGNGLISLAHQLMAAKLNVANGVVDPNIGAVITAADALIGTLVVPPVGTGSLSTSATSALAGQLAAFNEGVTGPGHCGNEVVN
jgi:hypothetical protein